VQFADFAIGNGRAFEIDQTMLDAGKKSSDGCAANPGARRSATVNIR
jgi:hypothetical protein